MMAYYRVTGVELSVEIQEHFKQELKCHRAARKWMKTYGGTDYYTGSFHRHRISGIVSHVCPGPEWCHPELSSSGAYDSTHWRPRRTKKGGLVRKEMESLRVMCVVDLQKIISYKPGFFQTMGYFWCKKTLVFLFEIHSRSYTPPRGVNRITDIEFEEIVNRSKK